MAPTLGLPQYLSASGVARVLARDRPDEALSTWSAMDEFDDVASLGEPASLQAASARLRKLEGLGRAEEHARLSAEFRRDLLGGRWQVAGVRTPVIMLTARTQEAEKVLGFEVGADDYVTKPYSARELRARIKAVLRRTGDDPPDRYAFGDAEVDFDRREVRRNGAPVALTPLEFRLLSVLVRHRGKALSRQQLMDDAWGADTFVTDRVVDNQVANLRKKIEPDPVAADVRAQPAGIRVPLRRVNWALVRLPADASR